MWLNTLKSVSKSLFLSMACMAKCPQLAVSLIKLLRTDILCNLFKESRATLSRFLRLNYRKFGCLTVKL